MRRMRIPILMLAITVVLAGSVAFALMNRPISQPIAFNHRLHIEEVGAECVDCHRYALTGPRATIPNISVCAECHEEPQTESAEEMRVVEHIREGVPIPWRKIYLMPDDVYFSHRRHAGIGKIECATCHGNVAEREDPITRPAVSMSMSACIDCHVETGVMNDCVLCHQ